MNKNVKSTDSAEVLLMISSCGQPVALVPADSIEEAQKRAIELVRGGDEQHLTMLTHEATVTLFVPSIVADGKAIAYLPTHVGHSRASQANVMGGPLTKPGSTH